jgi:hypothetical protein
MKIKLAVPLLLCLLTCGTATAQTVVGDAHKTEASATLSEAQKRSILSIQVESAKRAAPAALRLAATVRKIYDNMLAEHPDEKLRARLSEEMRQTTWELLSIKGQSMREAAGVLTPEQKRLIKAEMTKPDAPGDLMEVIVRTFHLPDK